MIEITNPKLPTMGATITEQELLSITDALHMAAGLYWQNLVEAAAIVQHGEDAVGAMYASVVAIQATSIRQITDVKAVLDKLQMISGMTLEVPNSINFDDLINASNEAAKHLS